MSETPATRTLGAVLFPDFELLDLYGPLEMFGMLGESIRIATIAEKPGPVRSSYGPETVAAHSFDDAPELDLVLLPGGLGTFVQVGNTALLDFLRERAPRAERVMSVCSGSAVLASAGVLDGRRATSNKIFFSHATDQSDKVDWVEEARWVTDGPFVTSSGVSAGTDMALSVIADLFGRERAEQATVFTEYEWNDDAEHDPFHRYLNQAGALSS